MDITTYIDDLENWMKVRVRDDEEGPYVDYPLNDSGSNYSTSGMEVVDIPVNCLIATQRLIYNEILEGMKKCTDSLPPINVAPSTEEPGYMYIIDGHHRVLKAIREGRMLIKARIYKECIWYKTDYLTIVEVEVDENSSDQE